MHPSRETKKLGTLFLGLAQICIDITINRLPQPSNIAKPGAASISWCLAKSGPAPELLERLRAWKQATFFSESSDWIFASPLKLGRLPYSYTGIRRLMARAAETAQIGHLTTHAFRHTYRTWLNATGTPIATQQKLMRHSTITMTIDTYGTVFDEEMSGASSRVARLAFHGERAQDRAHPR